VYAYKFASMYIKHNVYSNSLGAAKCGVFTSASPLLINSNLYNSVKTPTGFLCPQQSELSLHVKCHVSTHGSLKCEVR